MGVGGAGLIPIFTSSITINTFSIVVKVIVVDILMPNFMSCAITPTITSLVFIFTIIHIVRRTSFTQQSTMVKWVMVRRVGGLVPMSTANIENRLVSLDLYPRLPSSTLISPLDSPSSQLLFIISSPSSKLIPTLSFSWTFLSTQWEQKPMKSTIYHGHMGYGRNSGWYENYIHLSLQHKLLFSDCSMNNNWYIVP